ncbi:Biofilm operon icaABCD HTH-type negative transcriptional regulator IcaR [Staphylococcus aureus]|nr:Biofilm operon icaABCD HTH-type negative transcriptional regulator IcaR [Staphylococcus aureus]CAC9400707.1 Biofilm operon icaABCD HTH-type negative transcriptional regulator IcaR [Staphylococcus aureus]SRF89636.1 Biofilm operon icaABCD HTH-type negative transcriptional regulator IcaR [Staphylococcus aureus]
MKDKIIDNAITLFSEKGYDGTTLDDIAKSVNIKKRAYITILTRKKVFTNKVLNVVLITLIILL